MQEFFPQTAAKAAVVLAKAGVPSRLSRPSSNTENNPNRLALKVSFELRYEKLKVCYNPQGKPSVAE